MARTARKVALSVSSPSPGQGTGQVTENPGIIGKLPDDRLVNRSRTHNRVLQAVRLQERANTPSQDVRLA
jgi:hypothetical protein